MRYLLLAYSEETKWGAMSNGERDAVLDECLAHDEELRTSGRLIAAEILQSFTVRPATIVRVRSGKVSVMDGPFAETKELAGGFFLIDARDLNDAIQVAARMPQARLGSIEVRPIEETGHE
jgi:hypothetical protein